MKNQIYLLIVFLVFNLKSQDLLKNPFSNNSSIITQEKLSSQKLNKNQNDVAFDAVVKPEKYFLGPNDGIEINIWSSPPITYSLNVSPEGTLLIPFVGEVSVSDLLLSEAKIKIKDLVRKKYLNTEVSITLVNPRLISVTVLGNVVNPGQYVVRAIDRADKIIQIANTINNEQKNIKQIKFENIIIKQSKRNIVIKNNNENSTNVDLEKYFASKNDELNPYLREGDIVVVPEKDLKKNVISSYGEFNNPGIFEFVEGDKLSDLISLSYGFTQKANLDSLVVYVNDKNGKLLSVKTINTNLINDKLMDFDLEAGDKILIKPKYDLRDINQVEILGEVLYPGFYPITKDSTRISEIIKLAGGVTLFASLENSKIYRHSINKNEIENEKIESFRGGIPVQDTTYFSLENNIRLNRELVISDLNEIIKDKNSSSNILVKNGDQIIIADKKKTVYVFGQIQKPGHITFTSGKDYMFYIEQSDGFTQHARENDVKIIKSKTKQWLNPDDTSIEDGDQIWVPKQKEFDEYVATYSTVASVFATMALILVQIVQIVK